MRSFTGPGGRGGGTGWSLVLMKLDGSRLIDTFAPTTFALFTRGLGELLTGSGDVEGRGSEGRGEGLGGEYCDGGGGKDWGRGRSGDSGGGGGGGDGDYEGGGGGIQLYEASGGRGGGRG